MTAKKARRRPPRPRPPQTTGAGRAGRAGRAGGRASPVAAALRQRAVRRRPFGHAGDHPLVRTRAANRLHRARAARRRHRRPAARLAGAARLRVRGFAGPARRRVGASADLDLLRSRNGGQPRRPRDGVPRVHGDRDHDPRHPVRPPHGAHRGRAGGRPRHDLRARSGGARDPHRARRAGAGLLDDRGREHGAADPRSGDRVPRVRRRAGGGPVLPRVRARGSRPAGQARRRVGAAIGTCRDAARQQAPGVLRALLLRGAAGGRHVRPRWLRDHGQPVAARLGVHPRGQRHPPRLHGRARLPMDRRGAERARGAGPSAPAGDPFSLGRSRSRR